jgi:FMN phosphatase YigB (HAD superfamily)
MNIIFDYDHTVFDMMAMHEDIMRAMKEMGISERAYQDAYSQVTNWKMFTPEALAQRLNKIAGADVARVVSALEEVALASGKHVYADTVSGFEMLKAAGHDLYILSWGDAAWQMKKIEKSGLLPYCKEVLSVSQLKAEYFKTWAGEGKTTVFVDDKPAELQEVEKLKLGIQLIRMRRPSAKYSDQNTPPGMAEAKEMSDVLSIIGEVK